MSGTKIPNLSNLFRETKHFNSCVRIHACVTQFLKIRAISSTENCIVFATTGHARFEHARVLNNKMRAIQGFGIC